MQNNDKVVRDRANESAKRAKQFSPSIQYAITTALANIMVAHAQQLAIYKQ